MGVSINGYCYGFVHHFHRMFHDKPSSYWGIPRDNPRDVAWQDVSLNFVRSLELESHEAMPFLYRHLLACPKEQLLRVDQWGFPIINGYINGYIPFLTVITGNPIGAG